jgi:hypothetical protein
MVLAVLVLLPAAATHPAASQQQVLFEDSFERGSGAPTSIVRSFSVSPQVEGPFTMTIANGEADPKRAGAMTNLARGTVRLNGVAIAAPGDFANQSTLTRTVALAASNTLEVALVGAPHSHFTLRITGVINVAITAITPDNGPVDTPVLISGGGFDPVLSNNQVSFNGAPAAVIAATTTAIQTIVPEGATTGPITVTTPNGSASSAPFTVTSGKRLLISKSPQQQIYSRGQPITIDALVVDRHGQPVPNAAVTLVSNPPEDSRTGNTFVYQADGTFTITATSASIGGEPPLTASLTVTIDGEGAAIACLSPIDGGMITASPGSSLLFRGTVNSSHGVSAFTVNGADVAIVEGAFATPITTTFGLNVVDLAAVDSAGLTAHKICSFVVSSSWAPEGLLVSDTISLKAVQGAIDDFSRANAIGSFGDLLHAVVNSQAAHDAVDNALNASNPLKPSSCDEQSCTFLGCICFYRSGVDYVSSQLAGPNTTSLILVNGGLASSTRFENVVVRLRVHGSVGPVPYDVTGDVTYDYIQVSSTFDLSLSNGRPHVSVRPNSTSVQVGPIATAFSGVDSWIIDNVIVPIAQGLLRDAIANTLRNFVTNNFNAVLDGVFSSLDVTTPSTYAVPGLSQASTLTMSAGVGFSSLSVTPSRMLLGISTRFQTGPAHARPSAGAAFESGAVLLDPVVSAPSSLGDTFHAVIRGQALHALWRGGNFDALLTAGALNGVVPAGVSMLTTAHLPPVTRLTDDGRVEVAIGALSIQLDDAAIFPVVLDTSVAGRVSCRPALAGDALSLNDCTVDDLQFSAAQTLSEESGAQADALLRQVLGAILVQAARDAWPELPVPVFTLPASVINYGLPPNAQWGITGATLGNTNRHHVLRGRLGIR